MIDFIEKVAAVNLQNDRIVDDRITRNNRNNVTNEQLPVGSSAWLNDIKYCLPEAGGKRTYTVEEIQDILAISRTTAYMLIKKKAFKTVRVGNRIRISKKSFDRWLDQNC